VRGLNEIEQVDRWTGGESPLALLDVIDILTAVAAFLPAAEPHDAAGRVAVLSAETARFARPKHLFVGGLNEQAFAAGRVLELDQPATTARDERRTAAADEMLLFYQVITRAGQSLTLSYPALDDKAQPLVPSPLVTELERCLAGAPISRTVQSLGYADEAPATVLARGELRRDAVVRAMDRKRELLAALARESIGAAILDGIEVVASRARRERFEAFEGVLASAAVVRWLETEFGPDHLWSPSQLELYATCPFRFFGEQALGLKPALDLALADDLARRGHLLHDTLARMYAARAGAAAAGTEAATSLVEQFKSALDDAVRVRPGRGLHAAMREIERRQIASWAEKFAEQDAAYQEAWAHLDLPPQPAHFEARFGPGSRRSAGTFDATASSDKPFELVVPMGGREERVSFTGQIDRIDVGRAGGQVVFNVIDYKTSARAVVDEGKVYAGTQLQLPLYAMATAELLLSQDNAAALSAGYWSVRGKGFGVGQRTGRPLAINEVRDGAVQPAEGWEALRAAVVARLGEIITGIRRGWFPVFNDDKACATFCSLRTVCRIAHVRSLEKEWSPPPEAP
jgi:ATP-dependent helicase/DNAse subunit B